MLPRLSTRTKLIYGSGDLGFSLTLTIVGAYFAIFLTDVVGLQPGIAAAAIFIGRTWDYFNDPFMGHLSDRTRTRWGRRRPFLLFGALPFALAFVLLWLRPAWESQAALAIYYAFAYVLFDTAATAVYMPYFALTPELTESYDERTSLTSYRMVYSILGSLVAFTIPLAIVGSFAPENAPRVLQMALIFAAVSAAPLLLVFFNTRERPETQAASEFSLKASLKAAARNRPFVFSAVMFLLTWVCVDILQANLLFYLKYVIRRESEADSIMAAIFVTALLALPLWNWASRKFNKRLAYVAGIAFWAVVQLALISLDASVPTEVVYVLCILAGIGVGAAHVLPWSIIPDAIEWDEWQTGKRHEGMFYSLVTLMQKVASSVASPLTLLVLQATGYVPNAAQQPLSAQTGIRLVIGPVPAVLLLVGIIFALRYPLSREKHAQVVADLQARRAASQEK